MKHIRKFFSDNYGNGISCLLNKYAGNGSGGNRL